LTGNLINGIMIHETAVQTRFHVEEGALPTMALVRTVRSESLEAPTMMHHEARSSRLTNPLPKGLWKHGSPVTGLKTVNRYLLSCLLNCASDPDFRQQFVTHFLSGISLRWS
jgi:hypothetical protein